MLGIHFTIKIYYTLMDLMYVLNVHFGTLRMAAYTSLLHFAALTKFS
jgi:hypothetical protein